MIESKTPETDRIRVLQVMDKCAIRGSPIHGVSRLLLSWIPEFNSFNLDFDLCVIKDSAGCHHFINKGVPVTAFNRSKVNPLA